MTVIHRPRSIRGRCAVTVSLLALVVLAALGATTGLAIRTIASERLYDQAEDVASQWIAAARTTPPAGLPDPLPVSGDVDLVQIIDDQGTVLAASATARGRAPLTSLHPTPDDPVRHLSDGQNLLVAIRSGTTPEVLVVRPIPAVLRGHHLEDLLAGLVLALAAGAGAVTWAAVGRVLRPVAALRDQLARITLNDLGRGLPVPSGDGEIAELARTASGALARLGEDISRQRRPATATGAAEPRSPQADPASAVEPRSPRRDPGPRHEAARPAGEAAGPVRNSKHKASRGRTATAAVP
ncbi:hypothetical protein ABGB18_25385 [Nonomuraea sp. B12E4]|uniref:hypothetical protein n=1 Tax=Nonomuraea sp. B12E4 TaxID=3153564 RepID=UPI00325E7F46